MARNLYCSNPECRTRFSHEGRTRPTLCPACRSAAARASGRVRAARSAARRKARLEAQRAALPSAAPYLQVPLEELIRQADAASDRAAKAAANPAAIEPRPEPEPAIPFADKVALVMLYGDVSQRARNRWLLERGRRPYVDYFAPDAPVAPSDAEDKAQLAQMLGLDPDTGDIPKADEAWFEQAKLRTPDNT